MGEESRPWAAAAREARWAASSSSGRMKESLVNSFYFSRNYFNEYLMNFN
jgi:hypothetical protein